MIYDKEFLMKLDAMKNREVYAKITALTFDENPIEEIQGRVTAGSVNVDGSSAVRRTCSLTIVANNFNYNNYIWGLNKKFILEIGLKNTIDTKNYSDIIWFKQGLFVLTSFNVSRSSTNFTINLSGKDKMCLLNGEVGGTLESSIDFGVISEENVDGNWIIRKIAIPEIIRNAVHVYGGEPYHNIIINDLDTFGLELLEYRYDIPLYLYRSEKSLVYENALLEDDGIELYIKKRDGSDYIKVSLSQLDGYDEKGNTIEDSEIKGRTFLEPLVTTLLNDNITVEPVYTYLKVNNKDQYTPWYFTKVEYGQTAGYRESDLVYAGDLIAKIGESLTSVLDKIKTMLTEFEYFYNLDGQFVFQKKQSFISTMWNAETEGSYSDAMKNSLFIGDVVAYTFTNNELITAFNNNPNILNMRNDFSVWGERQAVSGAKIPVHLRFALDEKPTTYKSILVEADNEQIKEYNRKYRTNLKPQITQCVYTAADIYSANQNKTNIQCDWREIIYQMAKDYFKYNHLDDFEMRVAEANPQYPLGRTGYENYYTDLQGFWRELYYPGINDEYSTISDEYKELETIVRRLKINLYGTAIEWSENNLGGLENDVAGLQNFLSEDDTEEKATSLISWWNNGGSIPDNISDEVSSGYYLISYEEEADFNADQRKKYILLEDGTYELATTFTDRFTDYYTTTFLTPKYKFIDDNNQPIQDPTLYLGMLQDLFFRTQSTFNTKSVELDELSAKKDALFNNITNNFYIPKDEEVPNEKSYWSKNIYEAPHLLNFWFDFLDGSGELSKYNVHSIGARPKAINDTNVKSIYFRETPEIVFRNPEEGIVYEIYTGEYQPNSFYYLDSNQNYILDTGDNATIGREYYSKNRKSLSGFKEIQVANIDAMFTISSQGKSAKEKLDELLYQHSYCIDSATITAIPIYYLEPNTRIKIFDNETSLNGDYIVNKITIPLTHNGTMSLSIIKAAENII